MTQVFISYSRKDLVFVERLAKDVRAAGLEVWYDLSGLEVGTRWGKEIQNALQQSQYILVVLSPNSVESEWVEKEFLYANNLKRKIIPLLYSPCNLPMWFINLHFIDVQGKNYELHFVELLKALGIQPVEPLGKAGAAPVIPLPMEPVGNQQQIPQVVKSGKKKINALRPKTKLSLAWIILPFLLVAVIVFAIWGMQPLIAWLAPTPTLTVIATHTPTHASTPTLTSEPSPTATPTSTSTPGIGSTRTRPADNMVMVFVPGGTFRMGQSGGGSINEDPLHTVNLDAYWMDQTEVTNAMYALCVGAGGCQPPSDLSSRRRSSYYGDPQFTDYPVIYVDWTAAGAYCGWAGARLPTEAEWEKAARGTDDRIYPWGNSSASCLLGNFVLEMSDFTVKSGECVGDTSAVGSFPSGASPYGALDMSGNVKEWVYDWYDGTFYSVSPERNPQGPASGTYRVVRGSAWNSHLWYVRTNVRGWLYPDDRDQTVGFRCARDANP